MGKKIKERIEEGGAIESTDEFDTQSYSDYMKKNRWGEYERFVKFIIDNINLPKNATVLEIGPGPGWIGILLAKLRSDIHVIGLEPSLDMIETASKNKKIEDVDERVTYINGFVEKMDKFEDKSFDLVFSNESLHHWVDPTKAFKEIGRVLTNDGKIYVQDGRRDLNLFGKFILNILGRFFAGKMWKYWKSSINASYTPDEMKAILKKTPIRDWTINSDVLNLSIVKV